MKDKNLLKAYSTENLNKEFENTLAYSIVALTWLTVLCIIVMYSLTRPRQIEETQARKQPINVDQVDRNIELTENTAYECE